MKTVCVYHGDNCSDGFGAACAVNTVRNAADTEYVATNYGDAPPDCWGKELIIVDFSYKRDVMLKLINQASSVIVLDHHQSAMKELAGLDGVAPNVQVRFSMEKSGARLAWEFFHPNLTVHPRLIDYIEDRDLCTFRYPESRPVVAAISAYEYSFKRWTQLFQMAETKEGLAKLILEGNAIERKNRKEEPEGSRHPDPHDAAQAVHCRV